MLNWKLGTIVQKLVNLPTWYYVQTFTVYTIDDDDDDDDDDDEDDEDVFKPWSKDLGYNGFCFAIP